MRRLFDGSAAGSVAAAFLLPIVLSGACRDQGPGPASLVVNTAIVGEDVPDSNFLVRLDDRVSRELAPLDAVVFPELAPGEHTVELERVAVNCEVAGENPRTIEVRSGERASVRFNLTCEPAVGTIRAVTTTVGEEPDTDGYVLLADEDIESEHDVEIEAGDQVTFLDLPIGSWTLALGHVAPNCLVSEPALHEVTLRFQDTVEVAFVVDCVVSGTLRVDTDLTGETLDQELEVTISAAHFDTTVTAPLGETVTLTGLRPGDYHVALSGLTGACDVLGAHPRAVSIVAATTAESVFDVACSTGLIAFVTDRDGNAEIYIVTTDGGTTTRLTTNTAWDGEPAWSPDGTKIAFASDRDGDQEIYVMNADGSNPVRLTTTAGADADPSWSPDGSRIAFASQRDGNSEIYVMNADGSSPSRLTTDASFDGEPAWSPLGDRIAFRTHRHGESEIYVVSPDGTGEVALTTTPEPEYAPAWSPDGSRIAFARGRCEYYNCPQDLVVMGRDGSNAVRFGDGSYGDTDPTWSPSGLRIAYTIVPPYYSYYYDYSDYGLGIARPDGSDVIVLVERNAYDPSWRP